MKKEQPIVSTLSNFVASNVALFVGMATGIIVTRSLGPELKGEYANLVLIVSLYGPFLLFGYQGGVLFYGLRKLIDLKNFFWTGAILTLSLGICAMPLLAIFVKKGYLGTIAQSASNFHVWLALSSIPVLFLNAYFERVVRVYHLFTVSNVRNVISLTIPLLYYLVLWFTSGIDITQALFGILLGQVSALILNLYFAINKLKVRFCWQGKYILFPFSYGYKAWLNNIIAKTNDKFDQIVLTFLLAPSAFGIYVVGVGLSNLVTNLPSSYINVFFNQVANRSEEQGLVLYSRAQRITFILTTFFAIVLAMLSFPLIHLLYGSTFASAGWVVVLYSPGLVFQVAARVSIKFYAGHGKPLKNSLIYIAGIIVGFPFYYLLIPDYGIKGAAVASSITYLSGFIFSFWQINKDYGIPLSSILIPKREDFRYVVMQFANLPVLNKWLTIR